MNVGAQVKVGSNVRGLFVTGRFEGVEDGSAVGSTVGSYVGSIDGSADGV